MSLRLKYILYLLSIHLLFAGVAALLLAQNRLWLIAIEVVFVISFIIGLKLAGGLFGTLDLIRDGAEFIKESDFTPRFREVGHPEMNQLLDIYNRMADHLREERIRLQEQHFLMDRILNTSPTGFIILDFNGRVADANPAAEKMMQASAGSLKGKALLEMGDPFGRTLADLKIAESKIIVLWGSRRIKCSRFEFLDRGFTRSVLVLEELTEELRQTESAAYGKLIRIMSHEVNNSTGAVNSLLNSCLNYSPQLRDEDRKDFETALRVVISRTAQLNSFMRNFADVVRLPPPQPAPCGVHLLLQDTALLMKEEIQKAGVQIEWNLTVSQLSVNLDRAQMEQVLVNIFKNGLEAMQGGGKLTIQTGIRDDRKYLSIEDTGCGMSAEVQANLFVPFFSTKANGQGIGLTLIQEILTHHHFDFALESKPNGPTRFTIFF
ncbi:MAG: PAS domain-containing protein [Acidobacteria bacterium]|nr:PAS domain-containing protein [Acidobacteriota bacterium]